MNIKTNIPAGGAGDLVRLVEGVGAILEADGKRARLGVGMVRSDQSRGQIRRLRQVTTGD